MKVVIEYLVLHEVLQSVHLWHSTMKYMPLCQCYVTQVMKEIGN